MNACVSIVKSGYPTVRVSGSVLGFGVSGLEIGRVMMCQEYSRRGPVGVRAAPGGWGTPS